MKRFVGHIGKCILLIMLAVASVPSIAYERVCVIVPTAKIVPIGQCGMPCCYAKIAAPKPEDCCLPKIADQPVTCLFGNMNCRCETRVTAWINAAPAAPFPNANVPVDQPVVLTQVFNRLIDILELPSIRICGDLTRGPPPKVIWSPDRGRAPPFPV